MRVPTALLLTAIVVLAGCSTSSGPMDEDSSTAQADKATPRPDLPQNVNKTVAVGAAFDVPLPAGEPEFCWTRTHHCVVERFTIPDDGANVSLKATAQWTRDGNNFGLLLFEKDRQVDWDSGPRTSGTSRAIDYRFVEGGTFELVLDAHWAVADDVRLRMSFDWA